MTTPTLLTTLESLLVKEFRALQTLLALTRDERSALTAYDCEALVSLVEQKEILLDELGRMEHQRQTTLHELIQMARQRFPFPDPAELLAALDATTADRIARLQEGMTVVSAKIRELTPGNQVLAATAIERLDATQTFLLKLFQPPPAYQPAYYAPALQPAMTFDLDHHA
ncbi:MAG: flagellar protein FlgN [Anaerolineales bacterium]|nr:flagellar protein FlgN [Anaerolineales bacterium]